MRGESLINFVMGDAFDSLVMDFNQNDYRFISSQINGSQYGGIVSLYIHFQQLEFFRNPVLVQNRV